jgi:hypothetical protein
MANLEKQFRLVVPEMALITRMSVSWMANAADKNFVAIIMLTFLAGEDGAI